MRGRECVFEAICRRAAATRGSTVTLRSKPFGWTGYRAKALLTFLAELGCMRIRSARAYKMVCPKEVLDRICQGYYHFIEVLRRFGVG